MKIAPNTSYQSQKNIQNELKNIQNTGEKDMKQASKTKQDQYNSNPTEQLKASSSEAAVAYQKSTSVASKQSKTAENTGKTENTVAPYTGARIETANTYAPPRKPVERPDKEQNIPEATTIKVQDKVKPIEISVKQADAAMKDVKKHAEANPDSFLKSHKPVIRVVSRLDVMGE
jgi:hypothetical protein